MLVLLTKGLLSCVVVVLRVGHSFIQEFWRRAACH